MPPLTCGTHFQENEMKNDKSEKIYTCEFNSPLGKIKASATDYALTGLWFVGQKYFPTQIASWIPEDNHKMFKLLRQWLENYFSGRNPAVDFPIEPKGSEFQQKVWKILREIPYGQVTTYGQIAAKIAEDSGLSSMSAQAVGGAVGHNPVSILIPCHRVVGADSSLTGYAGGIEKKAALLHHEKTEPAHNFSVL